MIHRNRSVATLVSIALLALVAGCRTRPSDVILILVDTLRADHLSAYRYPRQVSPHLDEFARSATLFESAMAQAPHTIPSVLQIMTSRYVHGSDIDPRVATLAETLRAHGYQTAAVVENANFEAIRDAHGLVRGFDRFYRNGPLHTDNVEQQHWKTKTPADCITAQAVRWLRTRDRDRPFFLWLHYFDPHDPYMPPFADDMEALTWQSASQFTGDIRRTFLYRGDAGERPAEFTAADRQHLIDLYDAEIRYLDQSLGELFDALRSQGLFERSLIIVAADHGESFGEHGTWTHGYSLYEPEVHIPLIVKLPGQTRGRRVPDPVQAIDIAPTVLDVAGIQADTLGLEGTSLRQASRKVAFTFWEDAKVVRTVAWKLVTRGEKTQLFRLPNDPDELRDLAGERPGVVARLTAAGDSKLAALGAPPSKVNEVSSQTVERLRALGYLH